MIYLGNKHERIGITFDACLPRIRNRLKQMSRDDEIIRAAKLYREFREVPARRAKRVAFKVPHAVAVMGPVEFIGYMTTHNGKATLYIHEFAPGSRPLLAAGKGRGQLLLVGNRFRVTARGITDLDVRGRELKEAPRRYQVKQVRE